MKKQTSLPLKVTAALAMLVAISIIMGKYLAFGIGNVLRFSFENLPIIFAGMAFGPLGGVLVGAVADLIGCVLVGYAINPLVTLGAAAIGLVSGITARVMRRFPSLPSWLKVAVTVALSHLIGSVVIKTFGLSAFYDMPLIILMLWRLLNYVIVGVLEGLLLAVLFNNKMVTGQLSTLTNIRGKRSQDTNAEEKPDEL